MSAMGMVTILTAAASTRHQTKPDRGGPGEHGQPVALQRQPGIDQHQSRGHGHRDRESRLAVAAADAGPEEQSGHQPVQEGPMGEGPTGARRRGGLRSDLVADVAVQADR